MTDDEDEAAAGDEEADLEKMGRIGDGDGSMFVPVLSPTIHSLPHQTYHWSYTRASVFDQTFRDEIGTLLDVISVGHDQIYY